MENLKEEQKLRHIWYAVKTSHCLEERLGDYLVNNGIAYFIPKRYEERIMPDGQKQRELVPAVHNLLFMEITLDSNSLNKLIGDSPIPFFILCHRETKKPCEISDLEIAKLQALCDPKYKGTIYTDVSQAELISGSRIRIKQGQFKGLEGKLSRYKNLYYVVVTVATLGVMAPIPKWYCERLD